MQQFWTGGELGNCFVYIFCTNLLMFANRTLNDPEKKHTHTHTHRVKSLFHGPLGTHRVKSLFHGPLGEWLFLSWSEAFNKWGLCKVACMRTQTVYHLVRFTVHSFNKLYITTCRKCLHLNKYNYIINNIKLISITITKVWTTVSTKKKKKTIT
jgi:hypothetical protein